ncbi:alpha/beta hydrolase [Streptomyces purpureus]|uniref:DUF1023 domain-containing protein n=1 Tax=Streptomyces purpureus TaxID=1951 RepID=A0A918HAV1_9ACTN|nr:alpha/beta hydrolase [Streptomyces purpureus]GGT48384.1 hypothetical protein GCM10014713_48430 [Streptomyces purpureus]
MRRYKRTLAVGALVGMVVGGTVGWVGGGGEAAVTGGPPGVGAWRGAGLPEPEGMSAERVAAYFGGLSRERQKALAETYPLVVGNLDGAPVALRYAANARALAADGRFGQYAGQRVLAFDPRGRGQVAVVYGDLAAARNVAVVVPGSDIDAGHSAPLLDQATSLRRATGGRTAVIAWAGYTTPVGVGLDAATGDLAEAGAERLARFTDGLAATGSPAPSLFCHSYGSVVCGLAAAQLKAKDLVVLGSPGMRADNARQLHTSARVWAAKDPTDWISKVPNVRFAGLGHGTDPASPAFGARVVPASDAVGHNGYFAPGTQSLRTFAAIATGEAR